MRDKDKLLFKIGHIPIVRNMIHLVWYIWTQNSRRHPGYQSLWWVKSDYHPSIGAVDVIITFWTQIPSENVVECHNMDI